MNQNIKIQNLNGELSYQPLGLYLDLGKKGQMPKKKKKKAWKNTTSTNTK